jgi:hypothetical protein
MDSIDILNLAIIPSASYHLDFAFINKMAIKRKMFILIEVNTCSIFFVLGLPTLLTTTVAFKEPQFEQVLYSDWSSVIYSPL